MNRIHDSLQRILQRHRLVLWYDAVAEWEEAFDEFVGDGIVKLRVSNNEFATKVRITREREADTRFLVYFPSARPADADNWLLDLLLQGHEYRADKASLALQDAGIPHEFLHLAEEHAAFFNSTKRVQALKEMVSQDDQERDIRLKMMAVLTGAPVDVDALLLHFLDKGVEAELVDPVVESLGSAALVEPFWREVGRSFGYVPTAPTLRDFLVSLFRGANPLDPQVQQQPHARVFLQRWKDSQAHKESFQAWAKRMERELQVAVALGATDNRAKVGECDTFELFEKYSLHRLCQQFREGASATDLKAGIQQRRRSFWHAPHAHGYAALEHAVALREMLASVDITVESLSAGAHRYTTTWWRIDTACRRCVHHLRGYGQVQVMEPISEWVEKAYVNNFLLPLSDRWSDQVRRLDMWECAELPAQRRFFETYVQPFLSKGQKVFVIVSDALRYEAASEFAEGLLSANRWTAEVEAIFGALPSYTQLGMASLLPGRDWTVDAESATVTVDGHSAIGTANRAEILARACGGRATAVQAEDFLELNSKTEGRALMRDQDVIYIFHNHIDKVGDSAGTEAKTTDAVTQAFEELDRIIRKVASINGTNMLLTADHGFLFQQEPVSDEDMTPLPAVAEWTYRNRRFALGRDITPAPGVKVFSAAALGVSGDWSAAFPLSLGRFPLQGSGKRYVHGGMSLQEVIVPVVKIHKARTDDTDKVEVDLLRVPAKITTGQLSIALFQEQSAVDKVLSRTLRVGLYAKDGTPLSEVKTQVFDSRETEARLRETSMLLVLSHAADSYNNHEIDLRLEEMVPGTNQWVTYKTHGIKLQKPFMSDFDDL